MTAYVDCRRCHRARADEGKDLCAGCLRVTAAFYATKAGHLVRLLHHATPLRHLTRQHLDAYVARRRVEGVSSSTIHKELETSRCGRPVKPCARTARRRGA